MKFIVISYRPPGTTDAKKEPQKVPEAYRAWELYRDGIMRETYWRQDGKTGVVNVMEGDSIEEVRDVLNSLPMVIGGTLDFEIIPVEVCNMFEELFREEFV
ncbi:superoxide dismutase [Candidatus Foliamicus sp.]